MRYVSTRGRAPVQGFEGALLAGLADDGGLYVPEAWPTLGRDDLAALAGLPYARLAARVLQPFVGAAIGPGELEALVADAYAGFDHQAVAPLVQLDSGLWLLELFHGPTLAFKDLALQVLGRLFDRALARRGERATIVGATSGDTGSAAIAACRDRPSMDVVILHPKGRVSAVQRRQMTTVTSANVHNVAIEGTFDDCQGLVKRLFADDEFRRAHNLAAINSINWARIAAQVVYYCKGWLAAAAKDGDAVSFAVPSGNFGNIYAGYLARRMGLPIRRLVLATNENGVLDEFFRTGIYRVRGSAVATSSPSMDITRASNFERFVYDLVERDGVRVAALWRTLDETGEIDLSAMQKRIAETGFESGKSTHADRIATIRMLHQRYGVVVDPHTADGVKVGLEHREPGVPLVCLETALPAKFGATIREALGRDPACPPGLEDLELRTQRYEVIEPDAAAVKRAVAGAGQARREAAT